MIFNAITPDFISEKILTANQLCIFCAPSANDEVASALIKVSKNLDLDNIVVIVDYDEKVFRLGYGINESLAMLSGAGINLRQQKGLRIGYLIVDNKGWMFTQLPMAVENQTGDKMLNGVSLSSEQVQQLIASSYKPKNVKKDSNDTSVVEVGVESVSSEIIQQVNKAIKENPPMAFNLERQVRIYQTHLQFVEIELEGGRIEARRISLPKDLKEALFAKEKDIEKRLSATYKLINGTAGEQLEKLRAELNELRETFAPSMGKRLGRVLLKTRKAEFDKKIKLLKQQLDEYTKSAIKNIQDNIEQSLSDLAISLASMVTANPPDSLKGRCSNINDEVSKEFLLDILRKVTPSAEALMKNTHLHCIYKDVTIEMLRDKDFQHAVSKNFQYEEWAKPFREFSAAEQQK